MTDAEQIWHSKTDDQLLEAGGHLADYTVEGERIIRAELKSRGLPDPPPTVRPVEAEATGRAADWRFAFTIVGFAMGGLVGFLTRPSVFLVGQLPFSTVITRGANLSGMDQLLIPAAQTSFNQMVLCALVGGVLGLGIAIAMRGTSSGRIGVVGASLRDGIRGLSAPPTADDEVLNNDAVVSMIAAGLGEDVIVEKIKYSKCAFALSSSDLAELKRRGASDRIISGMLDNQAKRGVARN